MTAVRSTIFNVLGMLWSVLIALAWTPALALPPAASRAGGRLWTSGLVWLARAVCGIQWRVVGLERLPDGPFILASRHESAWDTFFFPRLIPNFAYVMKRELTRIPVVGAHMRRAGSVVINRTTGVQALHIMEREAKRALADGLRVIVFPEGTRLPPGETRPYHGGIGLLYERCHVPVVPVALNSGRLWGRRSYLKRPGTITVELLEPIPPGLERPVFMRELRDRIEAARARLAALDDGGATAPDKVAAQPSGKAGTSGTGA